MMRLMRLPLLLLATLLLLVPAASSFAATYATPEALIKALYRYDPDETDAEAPSPYSPFFSDALNARFGKNSVQLATALGAVGKQPGVWKGQQQRRTPAYTTDWNQLWTIKS